MFFDSFIYWAYIYTSYVLSVKDIMMSKMWFLVSGTHYSFGKTSIEASSESYHKSHGKV